MGGMESIEERRRREEEERKARERAEKAKKERRCMACEKKTTPENSEELAPGNYYHKGCMKCSECQNSADEDTPLMMAPRNPDDAFGTDLLDPYCKFCYAKKFKISAIKIAEIVAIAPEEAKWDSKLSIYLSIFLSIYLLRSSLLPPLEIRSPSRILIRPFTKLNWGVILYIPTYLSIFLLIHISIYLSIFLAHGPLCF